MVVAMAYDILAKFEIVF